jgi:hypothetical protein
LRRRSASMAHTTGSSVQGDGRGSNRSMPDSSLTWYSKSLLLRPRTKLSARPTQVSLGRPLMSLAGGTTDRFHGELYALIGMCNCAEHGLGMIQHEFGALIKYDLPACPMSKIYFARSPMRLSVSGRIRDAWLIDARASRGIKAPCTERRRRSDRLAACPCQTR